MDWNESWTLEEYVISLFKQGLTSSKEFKTLLNLYGRDKLVGMWTKYKARETNKTPPPLGDRADKCSSGS